MEAARRIEAGTRVKVKTLSGEELKGRLLETGEAGVVIETRAGRTVDARNRSAVTPAKTQTVPYGELRSIERDTSMRQGTKVAIIASVVVGALVVLAFWAVGSADWQWNGPIW